MPSWRRFVTVSLLASLAFLASLAVGACSGDDVIPAIDGRPSVDGGPTTDGGTAGSLAAFLPPLPTPTGGARSVFAGAITQANLQELIAGPAQSGLPGDFFMRSARARFVIQSAERVIGIVPWGGNIVDAALIGAGGQDVAPDHLGEISMVYLTGRTCAHDRVEVLLDGALGGPAVIRATGTTAVNDYVNLRGLGYIPIDANIVADSEDGVACATTYTLDPDGDMLHVDWTMYNPGARAIAGPFGMLNDTGGDIMVFSPGQGFSHLTAGIDAILTGSDAAAPYAVYQGPGVAYGIIPRLTPPDLGSSGVVVGGASILIFGAQHFLDILDPDRNYLHLAAGGGVNMAADVVVGRDGNAALVRFLEGQGDDTTPVSGTATFTPSGQGAGARVSVFVDSNVNGALDASDAVVSYFDTAADGSFAGALAPGTYFVRADVADVSRSPTVTIVVAAAPVVVPALALPEPASYDFGVVDDDGDPLPAKITVVGSSPVPRDPRVRETYERRPGVLHTYHAVHGGSLPAGADPADEAIVVPAGTSYRVYFSHGPEWSVSSVKIDAVAGQRTTLPTVTLHHIVDTTGYVATAFHEHSLGSPDSPVPFEKRLAALAAEGIELFAATDHDRLTDYGPLIAAAGLEDRIQGVVGVEATPFAYGHFNVYPLDRDDSDPSGGAVDWGEGAGTGFAMLPEEIWAAYRDRGARIVQVSHPRSPGLSTFQAYFRRAGLEFDFTARAAFGSSAKQEVPNDWLRLPPGMTLFSDAFDVLEVWINFAHADSDHDGIPELTVPDLVLRDWMNFLSLGKVVTPVGNGDTHTLERDSSGMPRTLVRVPDDTRAAIAGGIADDVWATLLGQTPRDVVVTDGPMIAVRAAGHEGSALGATVSAAGGEITLTIDATSADWVDFDTVEIFANNTFDDLPSSGSPTALPPVACFTSRTALASTDPCLGAPFGGGAQPLVVAMEDAPAGGQRRHAQVTITLAAADIPTRDGHTGDDAWIVVRVRGNRAIVPVVIEDAITADNVAAFVAGDQAGIDAALTGHGASAMAFTAPVFVDFDGGGYRAAFAP